MISWIVIIILVVIGFFVLKMNHMGHRTKLILIILLALFLYISISVVYTQYHLKLDSTEGFFSAVKIYFGWLVNGFQNLRSLTGNAIKMNWTSSDNSLFNKTNASLKIPDAKVKK